ELIIESWRQYFAVLKKDLSGAKGKVSFTSDIWTDGNYCPFLTIMAHWISKDNVTGYLKLNMGLIAFHHIPSTHTGSNLVLIIL
ncbi:hypothetical protein SCLCIDRAFT_43256, partial [Scleroderma citrinum Foug A]